MFLPTVRPEGLRHIRMLPYHVNLPLLRHTHYIFTNQTSEGDQEYRLTPKRFALVSYHCPSGKYHSIFLDKLLCFYTNGILICFTSTQRHRGMPSPRTVDSRIRPTLYWLYPRRMIIRQPKTKGYLIKGRSNNFLPDGPEDVIK